MHQRMRTQKMNEKLGSLPLTLGAIVPVGASENAVTAASKPSASGVGV